MSAITVTGSTLDRTIHAPTGEQWSAYSGMFDYFNRELFAGELPKCILNFSRRGARNLGFFAPKRWESGGQKAHEISLNPVRLKQQPPIEVASTLVHEMAHLWQEAFGDPGRGSYHNKEWGSKMESIGLMPSNDGKPGGKRTGQQMTHYTIEGGPFARAFESMPAEYLLPWLCSEAQKEKAPSKDKVKFTCVSCGANAWGKSTLELNCRACDCEMTVGGVMLPMVLITVGPDGHTIETPVTRTSRPFGSKAKARK